MLFRQSLSHFLPFLGVDCDTLLDNQALLINHSVVFVLPWRRFYLARGLVVLAVRTQKSPTNKRLLESSTVRSKSGGSPLRLLESVCSQPGNSHSC